jgi:hypothetical protein
MELNIRVARGDHRIQNRKEFVMKKRIEKKVESFEEMVSRLASKVAKREDSDDATVPTTIAYFERFTLSENGFLNILGQDGRGRFVDVTVHPKRSKLQRAFFALLDAIDRSGVNIAPTGTLAETALKVRIVGTQEVSKNKVKVWLNRSPDLEIKTPAGELYKLANFMPTDQPRQLEESEEIPF